MWPMRAARRVEQASPSDPVQSPAQIVRKRPHAPLQRGIAERHHRDTGRPVYQPGIAVNPTPLHRALGHGGECHARVFADGAEEAEAHAGFAGDGADLV